MKKKIQETEICMKSKKVVSAYRSSRFLSVCDLYGRFQNEKKNVLFFHVGNFRLTGIVSPFVARRFSARRRSTYFTRSSRVLPFFRFFPSRLLCARAHRTLLPSPFFAIRIICTSVFVYDASIPTRPPRLDAILNRRNSRGVRFESSRARYEK